jgi:hypothetical protein
VTRLQRLAGGLLAGAFLALHLPFLPPSLEDLDSINFALGLQHYDVSQHQPHPPGYPVFIGAAKLVRALGFSEVHALSVLGIVAGTLGMFACVRLFALLDRDRPDGIFAWLAALAAAACPLVWVTAARPLSDMTGLAASVGVQGVLLASTTAAGVATGALLAGLAAGIRSQVVWLTVPLAVLAVWQLPRTERLRGAARALGGYAIGALLWAVPLVMISGGPSGYLRVLRSQGTEDLTGVVMLATHPSVRQLVTVLQNATLAPWVEWPIAAIVLAFAAAGLIHVARHSRPALLALTAAFGPYVVFDLLFQEAITTRYAMPIVLPVVYLAVRGASLLPRPAAIVTVVAIVLACAVVSDRAMAGYSTAEAPAFRMLGDMHAAVQPEGASVATTPVLAMHRREYFDFRRPFQWVGDRLPPFAERLATPPKHEWLEVVKYWNNGGHEPVWFVADPLRSDLALFKYDKRPVSYRWSLPPILLGGARPNEMDWHVIESPDWYLGEGWALTPETAGTAREDRKGPGYGPINGWIRRHAQPVTLMIGGRNLGDGGPHARLQASVDGASVLDQSIAPGFFLQMLQLPSTLGPGEYAQVSIASDNPQLAIEQFDAQPSGRLLYGFGEGWNEQEYNPVTGVSWRWSSDRSAIRLRAEGTGAVLSMRGEIEAASSSHVTIRAGSAVAGEFDVGRTFSVTTIIPRQLLTEPETVLTIESSAFYIPAETKWRSRDRRKLGLKLTELVIRSVS